MVKSKIKQVHLSRKRLKRKKPRIPVILKNLKTETMARREDQEITP